MIFITFLICRIGFYSVIDIAERVCEMVVLWAMVGHLSSF
jgi:hypothetical protein